MFEKGTMVVWVTMSNTFMGRVIESGENRSIVKVTSTATGKGEGRSHSVKNEFLSRLVNGRAIVESARR